MTEGPTLLPGNRVDKRTKEVFAVSLQRVNARSWRGFAPGMDWLDEGLSIKPMIRPTVADDVTVHVANRYFSFGDKDLSFIRSRGKLPRQPNSMV